MPRHFSTGTFAHEDTNALRTRTLDTDEGSTGDRSRARRSILLVRREPPPSLTFLSLLWPRGGRLERRSRLRAAGHTGEAEARRRRMSSGGKNKKKEKKRNKKGENLFGTNSRIKPRRNTFVSFFSRVQRVLVSRVLIKEV